MATPIRRSPALILFVGSLAALAVLILLLVANPSRSPDGKAAGEPLIVYCAAGLKTPVEAIAREYEREEGAKLQLQYGGSQTLLANLEVSRRGDLYIPGDDTYNRLAQDRRLARERIPLARMRAVLAVKKGNPHGIRGLEDLLRSEVRVVQANPDAAAIGKCVRELLTTSGEWAAIQAQTKVFKPTVNDVANDLRLGAADAGFIWDATLAQYPDLELVPLAALSNATARVEVSVLTSSRQPTAALRLARYLAAVDRGQKIFQTNGYAPENGDKWVRVPEIRVLAGAMLRPAIEQTITRFEQREGARVTRVYNGCGILVAQMRAGDHPDAYFACDQSFMNQVLDLYGEPAPVSLNQLVILVPKGNPRGIRKLEDLGQPGLKLGVGHEKQCALGALTGRTLDETGLRNPVMKNVTVQSPTGDLLVNQLKTRSLDAVVAYISNAAGSADVLEAIPIDVPCALATQPVAVGRASEYKQLTGRLLEDLQSAQSREIFEKLGFQWKGKVR